MLFHDWIESANGFHELHEIAIVRIAQAFISTTKCNGLLGKKFYALNDPEKHFTPSFFFCVSQSLLLRIDGLARFESGDALFPLLERKNMIARARVRV